MRQQTWSATRTCAKKWVSRRFGVFWLQTVHRSQPRKPNRWKKYIVGVILPFGCASFVTSAPALTPKSAFRRRPARPFAARSKVGSEPFGSASLAQDSWIDASRNTTTFHFDVRVREGNIQEQCITRKNTYLSMYWCYWETFKLHAKLINRNVTHTKRCNNIFKRTRI